MSGEIDIQAVARRAAGRALAAIGRERHPHGAATSSDRPAGVHVAVTTPSGAERPTPPAARGGSKTARPLVTVDCLKDTPDGGTFRVARDVQITPLAQEEAWRRNIRFESGASVGGSDALVVAVGADHGGFALKEELKAWLTELGHTPVDLGTRDENACDYPDFARAVAEAVASGTARFGICVDGAGIGSAMAANKVPGVLAANGWCVAAAKNAREHNYANVLTLGAGMIDRGTAHDVVRAFLSTPTGAERHGRRVQKIFGIEGRYSRAPRAEESTR